MLKILFIIGNFIFSSVFALNVNNPLPNWIDYGREKPDGKPPKIFNQMIPPSGFRIPAEYEPVSAVVIGWAGYTGMLSAIARQTSARGHAKVWAVEGPDSVEGVPAGFYEKINTRINTVWMRDYGPFGISKSGQVGIVDTVYRHYQYRRDDDALPSNLGKIKKINVYGADIILDGGNFMVDSYGNLFMTKRTYIWNSGKSEEEVNAILKKYFNLKNIYSFEYAGYPGYPEDGTGHIDMFMKLLNDHTVLISTAETEPFKSNAEKAMAFFRGKTAPDGEKYRIITVKGWQRYGTWYTYTNSLIVNNVVLMPSYSSYSQENADARAAYKKGMPGVVVVEINSDSSISSGGSIHCITQTIPKYYSKRAEKKRIRFFAPIGSEELIKRNLDFLGSGRIFR